MTALSDRADAFQQEGYLVLRNFYDLAADVAPVQEAVRQIIALVAEKHGVDAPCATPLEAMHKGYPALVDADRTFGGEVYDAVKQIPAFLRLVSDPRNERLFEELRPGAKAGVAGGGYGVRIDNPGEERFRAYWHQEFPAQLRSLDGVVFWSPLAPVTRDLGPVELCPGSHRDGLVPVVDDDGGVGRAGAYALRLKDEQARVARYRRLAPLTEPGDLVVMDFLTLHQSGENRADRPRWSMQFRYFNFRDPTGRRIGWRGSFASGGDYRAALASLAQGEAS